MADSFVSVDDAAALIRPVDVLGVPLGPGIPGDLLTAMAGRDYTDLTIFGALLTDLYAVLTQSGVHYRSGFFGPAERFLRDSGADVSFIPADFRRFEVVAQRLAPRVVGTVATPPDADGWMSLSLHAGATVEEIRRAAADPDRLLIVEANDAFPRTFGLAPDHRHAVNIEQVDVVYRSSRPPFVLEDVEPTDADRGIAGIAAEFIPDGATIQTGIGGIPTMVATLLAEGPGGNYGIHSEMFTTGLMRLCLADKVTNHKGAFEGVSVTTFAAGTPELYDWLDGNDTVAFLPVSVVNSLHNIADNPTMVTINGAMTVDLAGQVVADTIDGRQFSGVGGHEDFVSGGGMQVDDRSLICLPSTATVGGEMRSRILARSGAGTIVSTPRHQIDVVITEFGAAELAGRSIRERARALAAIAHPAFRDELLSDAEDWPRD